MKSLVSLLYTFIFSFTNLMAYNSGANQEVLLDRFELVQTQVDEGNQMTKQQFERGKKKSKRLLTRQLKSVEKKSIEKQTEIALKRITRRYKKLRRLTSKSLQYDQRLTRLAKRKGMSVADLRKSLEESASEEKEQEAKDEVLALIEQHGSYAEAIKANIQEVDQMSYETVGKAKVKKGEVDRRPAQVSPLSGNFIILMYIAIPLLLFAITMMLLITGGILGGVIFGALLMGYVGWVLFDIQNNNRTPKQVPVTN